MKSLLRILLPASLLGTAALAAAFDTKPLRPFLEARCLGCHDGSEAKGGLNLEKLSTDLSTPEVREKWTLIFDRTLRGEMPPKKKPRPPAAETRAFLSALGTPLVAHDAAAQAGGRTVLRRLNRDEYERTVHDLLGIEESFTNLLPADTSTAGFDNVGAGLRLSTMQVGKYLEVADAALDAALLLGPAPAVQKVRNDYHRDPGVERDQSRPSGAQRIGEPDPKYKHARRFRWMPDGSIVNFMNDGFGVRDARIPMDGKYRLRIKAQAFQSGGKLVRLKVLTDNFATRTQRMLGVWSVGESEPREIEIIETLEKGEPLSIQAIGIGFDGKGESAGKIGAETFTGPGLRLLSVDFEGPLFASWPPPSVARVFGDLAPKPVAGGFEITSANPQADAARLVAAFAQRAFRRPVPTAVVAGYTKFATDALDGGAKFQDAVRSGCKAVLCAPEFLFLQESGSSFSSNPSSEIGLKPKLLDDYALASRLSYFLWSTMPDDALMKLAAAKKLSDPATLRAQTERLLKDPRSLAIVRNFTGQWLDLRKMDATAPDTRLYPDYDPLLRHAMPLETEAFFTELLRADLSVTNFIHSDFAMLNERLALHYGIAGVAGAELRKVALPPGSKRGGLLGQAAVLKVTANGTTTSPVLRGVWVMKHLLGITPLPPPPGTGGVEPDTRGASTIRELLDKHRSSATCAGCHQYMDPPGFALESYDVIGGWRDRYRSAGAGEIVSVVMDTRPVRYRVSKPVDPSGELPDGRKFTDLDSYKKLLLDQREQVARTVVTNLVTYATGAPVSFADRNTVEAILQKTKTKQWPLRTLVHEVVQSTLFQTK